MTNTLSQSLMFNSSQWSHSWPKHTNSQMGDTSMYLSYLILLRRKAKQHGLGVSGGARYSYPWKNSQYMYVIPTGTVSTSVPISVSKNSTRKEHQLTVWIPHCYLPNGLPVVCQQQPEAGYSGLLPLSGSSCQNPIILDLESDSN